MIQENELLRRDYISLDPQGEPHWDLTKIYPDPAVRMQFKRAFEQAKNMDEVARMYPEWAKITSQPADVVYFGQGGHPIKP